MRQLLIAIVALSFALTPSLTRAESSRSSLQLSLPTPEGQPWKIIQGYACGTHNAWDRYSLDLQSANGRTYGAPVRAAADGEIFIWVPKSGTLILRHGDGIYTMYTHMSSAVSTREGTFFARGDVIGSVGDQGAPGTPHLHFTAFTANGAWASNRKSFPLSFAEGYQLGEKGGCSQHQGEILTAAGRLADSAGIAFRTAAEPNRWYNHDLLIEFGGTAAAHGFSFSWESDPAGDAPAIADSRTGSAAIADAGEGLHTLHIRGWDADGKQIVATYGPIGLDTTAPQANALPEAPQIAAQQPAAVEWPAAGDNGSGVAGYRIYVGGDPAGTSEWFVEAPHADLQPLEAGTYLLRVQPLDYAGNSGEWTTIGQIIAK